MKLLLLVCAMVPNAACVSVEQVRKPLPTREARNLSFRLSGRVVTVEPRGAPAFEMKRVEVGTDSIAGVTSNGTRVIDLSQVLALTWPTEVPEGATAGAAFGGVAGGVLGAVLGVVLAKSVASQCSGGMDDPGQPACGMGNLASGLLIMTGAAALGVGVGALAGKMAFGWKSDYERLEFERQASADAAEALGQRMGDGADTETAP